MMYIENNLQNSYFLMEELFGPKELIPRKFYSRKHAHGKYGF